jgi:hypothetical protein
MIDRRFHVSTSHDLLPLRSWMGIRTGRWRRIGETPLTDAEFATLTDGDN